MQENSLIMTENVRRAGKVIEFLLNRPLTEMVGLGLIYGPPGLGKSRFAQQTAIKNNYIYLKLRSAMTTKSFALKLLSEVADYFEIPSVNMRGPAANLIDRIIEILKYHINTVIIIDEIDYAFKNRKVLGSIRDIADETLTVVLLVGMSQAKEKLLHSDAHYFDRCNYFCEFKPLTLEEIKTMSSEICKVKIEPELLKYYHSSTKGNIRKLVKSLYMAEMIANSKGLDAVGISDLKSADAV